MRIQNIMRVVGQVLITLALFIVVPFFFGILDEGIGYYSFLVASALSGVLGGVLYYYGTDTDSYSLRDGFLVVSSSWLFAAIFSALPFYFSGVFTSFVDALFEAVSGITTTGATMIDDVSSLPRSFILWRGLTNWIGGMGMIVLVLAFLRNLGADAAHFFEAEASVPRPGIVLPRIRSIAGNLLRTYMVFTIVCSSLLWLAGVDYFKAINLTFATVATGGLAPMTGGTFAYADAPIVCIILLVFMVLAGGNFAVYQSVWQKGIQEIWRDFEYRMYLMTLCIGSVLVLVALSWEAGGLDISHIQNSLFTLVSMQTGTGFAIVDYNQWPSLAQMVLFMGTFFGGCSGSTTGGIKIIRIIILAKSSILHLRKAIHPDMVQMVRLNGHVLPTKWLHMTQQFFFFYLLIFGISSVLISTTGLPIGDVLGIVTGTLGNVGLAFGSLGPTETLTILSPLAKVVCIIDMLLGRLELFTLLVLLHPGFWRGYFAKTGKGYGRFDGHRKNTSRLV